LVSSRQAASTAPILSSEGANFFNDVDWIFRNEIEAYRENRLYVDFVETDEGDEWLSPARWDDGFDITSGAVRLVAALHLAGFSTALALSVVADVWEGFIPRMDTRWTDVARRSRETLERMKEAGVVSQATTGSEARILDNWSYPLHRAALEKVKVKVSDLRRHQEEWDPGV
jgi:hypothetical protein